MTDVLLHDKERKKTKRYAWVATIVYIVLFPFLVMLAAASGMVSDSPSITFQVVLSVVILYFCIPLSIPVALYLVWSRFLRGHYRNSRYYCFIPLYVFGIVQVVTFLLTAHW